MTLRRLVERFVEQTVDDQLLLLAEGFTRVRMLEAALSLGWTIQEGVKNRNRADYATQRRGRIEWVRAPRQITQRPGTIPDVVVSDPIRMLLELKTISDRTESKMQDLARHDIEALTDLYPEARDIDLLNGRGRNGVKFGQ